MTASRVHRLAAVTAVLAFVLICAGGLVKSKGAGLAVPDWPQSYGQPYAPLIGALALLALVLALAWAWTRKAALAWAAVAAGAALTLTFYAAGPRSSGDVPWYQIPNVRTEHGHRLIAGTVGFLTAILAGALWHSESRSWLRKAGLWALCAVIVQALLGGLTVHMQLPHLVSAAHGALAQAFFALLIFLAIATDPEYVQPAAPRPETDRKSLRRLCVWMLAALSVQVMLGAALRHTSYRAEGQGNGAFHWHLGAHLAGLLWVGHTLAGTLVRVARRHAEEPALARPAQALALLAGVQVLAGIGALLVRLKGDAAFDAGAPGYEPRALALREWLGTAHVAIGALLLGAAVWLAAHAFRLTARLGNPGSPR